MIDRRNFLKIISMGGIATVFLPASISKGSFFPEKYENPLTNIKDALNFPRTLNSMPGKFPGRVIQVNNNACIIEKKFQIEAVDSMVKKSMLELTGAKDISSAWREFVTPEDRIGLKVNPVAGIDLTTSPEIVTVIINQLKDAGIPEKNILIWDRREFEMHEVGFNEERFPGIKIIGTERKDKKGSFYNEDGVLYSEEMIDKNWYYWADVEEKYDAETMPYMVNEGKYSYFTKIVTQDVDKIINIPILKNAGSTVTLCLKNLAYGSITNTGRLHAKLWSETTAEVCAFPPLRDKVVLNIVDGIKGCFNGGPGYNPQFVYEFKTVLAGTDPVAVDRIGYEIILKKRIEENIQKEESPKAKKFMEIASLLELGEMNLDRIKWNKFDI